MEGWVLCNRPLGELVETTLFGVNRLMEAAKAQKITLKVYSVSELDLFVTHSGEKTAVVNNVRVTLPDFIIPRVGASVSYFGLALIRQLEQLGVYVCNGSDSIVLTRDKLRMAQILNQNHIPIPKTMLMKYPSSVARIRSEIGFPVVIKMVSGTEGFGVHLCESERALEEIMEIISVQLQHSPMLIQEFVKDSYGCDLRVFVLNGKAIACMKRTSEQGFKANYSLGGNVLSYAMTPEIERLACASAELLGLEIAGIDLLFDGDGFKVCEANSSPGFKGIELATDSDIASKFMAYIKAVVLKRHSIFRP